MLTPTRSDHQRIVDLEAELLKLQGVCIYLYSALFASEVLGEDAASTREANLEQALNIIRSFRPTKGVTHG